ncbi:DUF4019 domain-containing protein [Paraburkholderia terrae]|uniref:DUF4019 domain-containing protein n=1 Tax=Paraburkholderia terrae TaxID=311230 RepID=A0A2I8ELD4_9BURK|nr:DUF4019 domain-containing protein [Paraburkholderia terrae]AUT60228.1 DUF4019 domain-containing protein [Paraburkholderia terrae]
MKREVSAAEDRIIVGQLKIDLLLCFVFGVIFVSVMLYFATSIPNPSPFSFTVFIVVLALAAAGVGAMLPGTFELRYKKTLRAAGGFAMFCIVLAFSAKIQQTVVHYEEPKEAPEPVALNYLNEVDSENLKGSWDMLDPVARATIARSFDDYKTVYKYRTELGTAESRKFTGTSVAESPSGQPLGLYRNMVFVTKFSKANGCRVEVVVLRATESLKWKPFSHQISPSNVPCAPGEAGTTQ